MTTWRCGRCHEVLEPGRRPPWCLGGDFRCDVTLAIAELPVAAVDQPARLRVHDLPRDVVRGLAGVLGVRQHGRTLDDLRDDVEAALRVDPKERMAA